MHAEIVLLYLKCSRQALISKLKCTPKPVGSDKNDVGITTNNTVVGAVVYGAQPAGLLSQLHGFLYLVTKQ